MKATPEIGVTNMQVQYPEPSLPEVEPSQRKKRKRASKGKKGGDEASQSKASEEEIANLRKELEKANQAAA